MVKNSLKKRCVIIFISISFIFGGLLSRLVCLQFFEGEGLTVKADSQYYYEENSNDLNYSLLDCNGKELLEYKNKYYAVVDPYVFKNNNLDGKVDELYALIYILRNYDSKYDLSNIGAMNVKQKIIYEVDEVTYNKLVKIKEVKGFYVYIASEVNRDQAWKIENLISSIRRPMDGSLKEPNSIEMEIYNKTKNNKVYKKRFNRDISGFIGESTTIVPTNNSNVKLTIDKNIQDKIKEVLLNNKYKKNKQVGIILMEANTGKIRGMSQMYDSLPNVNIGATTENGFYPGSIFKTIVEEGGLEHNCFSTKDKFLCEIGKDSLCKKGHGEIDVEQAFEISCNNIFSQIGEKVGFKNILDNAKNQGLFGTILNFDSEVKGDYVEPIKSAGGVRLVSIGQNMRITPVQAMAISNTIANGGKYVKPILIDSYTNMNNEIIESTKNVEKTVLHTETVKKMKDEMIAVVKEGTGKLCNIDGIEIGGKTGTTERMEKKEKHSDGWFVGFFKVKEQYYSMVVFVKDIDIDKESGGTVATPIFKDIVESVYQYLLKL